MVSGASFPRDPAVLACIRRLEAQDVPAVAQLHHASMGNSLWAQLGIGFLEALYRGLLLDASFIGFVYEEDGRVGGFIAGTEDAAGLFGRTLRRHALHLVVPTLLGLLRRPRVLLWLLTTPLYFARSRVGPIARTPASEVRAESLFCSFAPQLRGRRIAAHINLVLFEALCARGHKQLKITTEADNHAAIRQLNSMGLVACGGFTFYGKQMVTYVLDLGLYATPH